MATLIIRKVLGGIWEHYPSDAPMFILSNWYVKTDEPYFQIQEIGGSQRKIYLISQITVFDINGGPETFANFTALMVRLKALDYTAFEQGSGGGVVINDNTPSFTEVYSSQKVEDELDLIAVEILLKQNIPRLVDAKTTALNNEILHVTADATITDIVDAIAGDVYKVVVINGLATIGGQIYGKGETIERYFDGTIYITTLPNGQKYIDVFTNATVTNDWYLSIVKIKANCTITIPVGLNRRISFVCDAYANVTATFVAGTGQIVTSAKGLVLKNNATNTVYSDGLNNVRIIGEMSIT